MAYKALYRTYRPSSFKDMAGQKHIIKTLENAVNNNKIAHAYLFSGPRGTGKTSSAKIFAKAVNCTGEGKPCGVCENCRSAEEGNHPDIIEIDAASNNGVEEVRNLIDKVKYAPIKGKYKIYIIDEVHMMSQGAYNALLKTIEEPPAHIIFILATTEPYKVIPTIISRCQRFDFAKISNSDIEARLKLVADSEDIKYEDNVLSNIAVLADGGMRDALSILDQCYAYAPDIIKLEHIFDIYGIMTMADKLELLDFVNAGDTKSLMNKLDMIDQRGIDIKRLTVDLIELMKEKVIFDFTKDTSLLRGLSFEQAEILSRQNTSKETLQMIEILMNSYEKYKYATNVLSYLEIALLNMMSIVSRETIKKEENLFTPVSKPNIEVTIPQVELIDEDEVEEVVPEQKSIEVEDIVDKSIVSIESEIANEQTETSNDSSSEESIDDEEDNNQEQSIIVSEADFDKMEDILDGQDDVLVEVPQAIRKSNVIEDDYVLQLLVSANKKEKEDDREQMKEIHQYKLDIDNAKYANLLAPNEIVASGDAFIVVSTSSIALANELNDLEDEGELLTFVNLLFKKRKRVYAITNLQYERVVEDFKVKYRTNALPEPIVFDEIIVEEVEEKDEKAETLNILFGDNITIKENE